MSKSKKNKKNENITETQILEFNEIIKILYLLQLEKAKEKILNIESNQFQKKYLLNQKRFLHNIFIWKKLPNGLTSFQINEVLFSSGFGIFFQDKLTKKFYFLPASTERKNNFTFQWSKGTILPPNINNYQLNLNSYLFSTLNFDPNNLLKSTGIPIYFNNYGINLHNLIDVGLERLGNIWQSLANNLSSSNFQDLIPVEEGQVFDKFIELNAKFSNLNKINTYASTNKESNNSIKNFINKEKLEKMIQYQNQSDKFWFDYDKTENNLILKPLGIFKTTSNKTGAQETDGQLASPILSSATFKREFLNSMNENIHFINEKFGTEISVQLNDEALKDYFNFLSKQEKSTTEDPNE